MLSAGIWSAYGFYLELYILGVESMFVAFLNLLILFAIFRDRCIYSNDVHKNEPISETAHIRSIATKSPKLPKDVPPHRMAEIEEEEKSDYYNCENEKWTGIDEEGDDYNKRED